MAQTPLGFQKTTLVGLTTLAAIGPGAVISPGATFCYLQAEAQGIRWTDDGVVTPTASIGQLLAAGDTLLIVLSQFTNFQLIGVAGGAIANLSFYK